MVQNPQDTEYRKVQGIVGQQSFSIILPKAYAILFKKQSEYRWKKQRMQTV